MEVSATIDSRFNQATISFTLDDEEEDFFTSPGSDRSSRIAYHSTLWSKTVEDKEHSLVITHKSELSEHGVFFLDYITYTPTQNTPRDGLRFLVEEDDSRVTYSSGWSVSTRKEWMGRTDLHSQESGSTFELNFEGSRRPFSH